MKQYSDKVWRLFREPRRSGCFEDPEGTVSACARSPASQAQLCLHLKMADDGRIEEALFQALGCPSLIATGAWLCAWLIGRKGDSVRSLQASHIVEQLELQPLKRYCAVMAIDALNQSLDQHSKIHTQGASAPKQNTADTAS